MDARRTRVAFFATAVIALCAPSVFAGSYRTQNFLVTAPTAQLAREIGDAAEAFRESLAVEWLGQPMPPWSQPCPITAQVAPHLGAGGATSFYFENGRPFGWTMTVQGSRERVLDSVLPHEITHTVFASHFGRPLPRWADEGACTTVEHASERNKQERLLIEFLNTKRGIAFNKMFAMKEYPNDVLPLYSQGFSLARFLISQGGKRKFIDYVGDGMKTNNWHAVTARHYGFSDLSDLQLSWVEWVRSGSDEANAAAFSPLAKEPHPSVIHLVSARNAGPNSHRAGGTPTRVVPSPPLDSVATNAVVPVPATIRPASSPGADGAQALNGTSVAMASATSATISSDGWYAKQRDRAKSSNAVASRASGESRSRRDAEATQGTTTSGGEMQMVTRPQPPEQARQVIIEWSRPNPGSSGLATSNGTTLR